MSSRLRVPVEVPPEIEGIEDQDKLSIKINQIFLQKGPSGTESNDDEQSDKSDDETREERWELLSKTREELFEIVRRGTLQCNEALDFISLLLSKHSRAAESTFSPALKESVKPGMLDGLYLDNARYAPTIRPKQDLAKGWRTKSFLSATERLHAASKRLKREADSQSSFWAQVAEVGNEGWKVCRHPANRRQIGVIFGMPESAPQFRNQGFVTLQQDTYSNIQLARRPVQKRVSVAISRSGEITGKHTPHDTAVEGKPAAIRELIAARDCLTDEELFHELGREARLAANQGIITRGEDIEFTINDQFSVIIALQSSTEPPQPTTKDTDLARFISLSLRSLLVQAHHENYVRRTRPPPPISTKPAHAPEYAILRPLIAALRHSLAKAEFEQQLRRNIIAPLRLAGLDVDLKPKTTQQTSNTTKSDQRAVISVDAQQDTYVIVFPSNNIVVKITTYLGRPVYGVRYEILHEKVNHYESLDAFINAIKSMVSARLSNFLASQGLFNRSRWEVDCTYQGEVRIFPDGSEVGPLCIRQTLVDGTLVTRISGGNLEQPVVRSWGPGASIYINPETEEHCTLIEAVREVVHENEPGSYSDRGLVDMVRDRIVHTG